MKFFISAVSLTLFALPAASAETGSVTRVDLYATCIEYLNKSGKKWMSELYTAPQLEELDPYRLKLLTQECSCTVTEAFKALSQDAIQALNTSMKNGIGDIPRSKTKSSLEFQKSGMADKQIACNIQAEKTSGMSEKTKDFTK